jgi:hypothetical protein
MQFFCRLENTFSPSTVPLHSKGDSRMKMIGPFFPVIDESFDEIEGNEMKKRLMTGLVAAVVLGGASAIPADAACRAPGHCTKSSTAKAGSGKIASTRTVRSLKRTARSTGMALAVPAGYAGRGSDVVGLIKSMAPVHGVPTWFALRIAHVESNYNPRVRGAAGEYGVYQLKCSTAKGIGFTGNCAELLDARTNVKWGLKHLSIAIGKSNGNLRLAASKHNGGLDRRSLVPSYVAKVF